jgi:hypothetical protein
MRSLARVLTVGSIVLIGVTAPVRGQHSASIEPEAMSALTKMSEYLRSLKAFQVEAMTTREDVLADGQKVQFSGVTRLLAKIPNRLHIATDSDRHHREFFYDGKNLTLLARRSNLYATVAAPPTIGALADAIDERYAIDLPLVDLFRWGDPHSKHDAITSAMFIGPSEVGGVTCGHYAFRQDGLDWQVWIQMGDYPLPRKLALTTTTDEARPQYVATFTWNLAPSFNDAAFTFVAPKGAGRVVLSELKK